RRIDGDLENLVPSRFRSGSEIPTRVTEAHARLEEFARRKRRFLRGIERLDMSVHLDQDTGFFRMQGRVLALGGHTENFLAVESPDVLVRMAGRIRVPVADTVIDEKALREVDASALAIKLRMQFLDGSDLEPDLVRL